MTEPTTENRAKDCARQCFESIVESVAALDAAGDDDEKWQAATQEIRENSLSVQVRGEWHSPGAEEGGAKGSGEFCILLGWGGPAVRIIGDLDRGSPYDPKLQYQDWFTLWTDYGYTTDEEGAALLRYCEQFDFSD